MKKFIIGSHLEWRPSWIFTWLTFFSQIMTQSESTCTVWCLYHHLINWAEIWNNLPHYRDYDQSRPNKQYRRDAPETVHSEDV